MEPERGSLLNWFSFMFVERLIAHFVCPSPGPAEYLAVLARRSAEGRDCRACTLP